MFCGIPPCGTWCNTFDTCLISDYALNTLLHIGGTSSTTCGTNCELEDNAGCTWSGTRELAYNTSSMKNNNNKLLKVYNRYTCKSLALALAPAVRSCRHSGLHNIISKCVSRFCLARA